MAQYSWFSIIPFYREGARGGLQVHQKQQVPLIPQIAMEDPLLPAIAGLGALRPDGLGTAEQEDDPEVKKEKELHG